MTVQEMHIEMDLLLQKVNSHYNQNILPQEKDVFLNREVIRFIKQRINRLSNIKGLALFDTIKRTIDLNSLLKTVTLPVLYNNSKEAYIMLPFDYLYYIGGGCSTCCSCENKTLTTGASYSMEISPIKEVSSFPFTVVNGLFSFSITSADIPSDYLIEDTIPIYKNKEMLINAIMILIKKKNNTVVEFKYDKVKDKIIARSSLPFSINGQQASLSAIKYYTNIPFDLTCDIRIEDEEIGIPAKNSYLTGTKDESCLGFLRETQILLSPIESVIYGECKLTYLCKPNKISLSLQSNVNLADETMEEVVSNSVQRLHGIIGTDNYEKFTKENILIE